MIAPMTLAADGTLGGGEAVLFWIIAPLMVLGALGLIFARKAVYAAISVVFVMIGLAAMYVAQGAMFLGAVQIVVYTGAIMMLFVFVLMLIGVDASETRIETLKGQRPWAVVVGLGLVLGLVGVVLTATLPTPAGISAQDEAANPLGVARVLFANFPITMQLTGALLIVAAVSAIVLTTQERSRPKITQRDVADAKMAAWAERGTRIAQLPAPGAYATHTATDAPALTGGGGVATESVPRVLRVRGQQVSVAEVAPHVYEEQPEFVPQSQLPGMPGVAAPDYGGESLHGEIEAGPSGADDAGADGPEITGSANEEGGEK